MTQEQQRVAIAEWCGWKHTSQEVWKSGGPHHMLGAMGEQSKTWVDYLPDYCGSLDAIHEAVKRLRYPKTQSQWRMWEERIGEIIERDCHVCDKAVAFVWEMCNSTAKQRAEALCRTLWPERWEK